MEWGHHRALVHEARANIRVEMLANQKASEKNLASIGRNLAILKADLVTEQRLSDLRLHNDKKFHGSLNFTFSWDSLSESAWRTARDTGALGYMPYAEVQRYSDLYQEQARIDTAQDEMYEDDAHAYAPLLAAGDDPTLANPADIQQMIDATGLAATHLIFLKQMVAQLYDLYGKTLQEH